METTVSALARAECEAREAVEAAGLAKQRSADFAARRLRGAAGNSRSAGGLPAPPRGGYTRLADDSIPDGDDAAPLGLGSAVRSTDHGDVIVDGCCGIAPPPPEDPPGTPSDGGPAARAHAVSAEEAAGGFSLSRSAGPGPATKSGVHWIPMFDLRASRRTGRVNARLLLMSPRLHARVVARAPLVVVLWAVLIVRASPSPALSFSLRPTSPKATRVYCCCRRGGVDCAGLPRPRSPALTRFAQGQAETPLLGLLAGSSGVPFSSFLRRRGLRPPPQVGRLPSRAPSHLLVFFFHRLDVPRWIHGPRSYSCHSRATRREGSSGGGGPCAQPPPLLLSLRASCARLGICMGRCSLF